MNKTSFKSVDEYIAAQPAAVREILERVRRTIRKAVPAAEEVISYQIPAYKLSAEKPKDQLVIYFAAWKHHVSMYPATTTVVAEFADEIAPYFDHNSTLRFPLAQPVPLKLIERIAKFRAKEVSGRGKAKAAAPKPR